MDRFEFSSIKLLRLQSTDNPDFSVRDGSLTITATRDGSTIMIQAPITNANALAAIKPEQTPMTISIQKEDKQSIRRNTNSTNIRRGEKHYQAKLSDRQVRQIKECLSSKIYMKQFDSNRAAFNHMAAEHNVSWACIEHIHAGRTWKHI